MSEQERPTTAKSWRIERNVGLILDERVFPWHVAADPGPMVEALDGIDMHILWLPVFMDGPIPQYGRPDGEPIETTPPAVATEDNGGGR